MPLGEMGVVVGGVMVVELGELYQAGMEMCILTSGLPTYPSIFRFDRKTMEGALDLLVSLYLYYMPH
jgi:hypothetical protein